MVNCFDVLVSIDNWYVLSFLRIPVSVSAIQKQGINGSQQIKPGQLFSEPFVCCKCNACDNVDSIKWRVIRSVCRRTVVLHSTNDLQPVCLCLYFHWESRNINLSHTSHQT